MGKGGKSERERRRERQKEREIEWKRREIDIERSKGRMRWRQGKQIRIIRKFIDSTRRFILDTQIKSYGISN